MNIFSKTLPSLFLTLAFLGCAHKKDVKSEPVPRVTAPRGQEAPQKKTSAHYIVRQGDSLWTIASKREVLGNSFQWPLLYKQNRDQIQDPDLIEIRQDLNVGETMSKEEISEAIRKAEETPAYVPHTEVRKSLPVKY
jgi:hypothetical protein